MTIIKLWLGAQSIAVALLLPWISPELYIVGMVMVVAGGVLIYQGVNCD